MKKLHLLLASVLAGLIGTAYATCYVGTVVCCYATGDVVGTFANSSCSDSTISSYDTVWANEDAWRFGMISNALGGVASSATATASVYCDGTYVLLNKLMPPLTSPYPYFSPDSGSGSAAGFKGGHGQGNSGYGFQVYYFNCSLGSDMTDINDSGAYGSGAVNIGTLAHYLENAATCN